nr:immunoglobulin light chain junction region [Macaca mulatta]MOX27594.1 immunoglobulin light chain junction region [Macaca mulatta]MOX27905.1 immunoglobulin light chain junction region [Macaca mulatta]
CQQHENSPLTF